LQLKLGLGQRRDLMAAAHPRSVRRHVWFAGILGLWALIGTVSSLAVQHWTITAITLATAAFGLHVVGVAPLAAPHSKGESMD
jgi:uncharacterized membrane protein YccF (DUF307 family)